MAKKTFIISLFVLAFEILLINVCVLFFPRYVVKFSDPSIKNIRVIKGKKAPIPVSPRKDNMTFVEWQLNGKKYNFDLPITKNIELTAVWQDEDQEIVTFKNGEETLANVDETVTPKTYTVTFDTDGGSYIAPLTVEIGTSLDSLEEPTKEGYRFNGWLINDKHFSLDTIINSDITIKASWVYVRQHTITIIRNYYLWDDYPDIMGKIVVNYKDKITKEKVEAAIGYQNRTITNEFGQITYSCSELTYCDANTPYNFDAEITHDIKLCYTCK